MTDLFSCDLDSLRFSDLEEFATREPRPREGERVEFKRELSKSMLHDIVAMGNRTGGIIFVGVDEIRDQDSSENVMDWPPVGISLKEVKAKITSMCHAAIRPNYAPDIAAIPLPSDDKKGIVLLRIRTESVPRPLWIEDKGILTRVGDQARPADLETIRRLLVEPQEVTVSDKIFNDWSANGLAANADGYWLTVVAQRK